MGLLEDALRDTFAAHVAAAPAIDDLATSVIREAGRVRRRRVAAASVAAALSVALLSVGVVSLTRSRPAPTPRPPAAPAQSTPASPAPAASELAPTGIRTPPIDVVNGDRILTDDGRTISLRGMGTAAGAWRVNGGWLVTTVDDQAHQQAVWFVNENGTPARLVTADGAMVSAGSAARPGPQVAWTSGGTLTLATFEDGRLTRPVSTDGIDRLSPLRFVGAGVVLGSTATGGGIDTWDMWFPDRGAYRPTAVNGVVVAVLGATADNSQLLALMRVGDAGSKTVCLSLVDPVGFRVDRQNCDLKLQLDDRIYPSPGGHWWAVSTMSGLALYDAGKIWQSPVVPVSTWALPFAHGIRWIGDTSFVIVGHSPSDQVSKAVRLYVVDPGRVETVELPKQTVTFSVAAVIDLRS